MCGRYFRRLDKQRIAEAFGVGIPPTLEIPPDFNAAPSTLQPVIVEDRETGGRELRLMRWGLIPYWCEDPGKLGVSTINAQAETLLRKPIWREAFEKRRCLVPADGFYEWQKVGTRSKQPWAFGMANGEPLAFAGLWERWKPRDGSEAVESFSIITADPNELTSAVHNRMPVIPEPRDYERWLRREDDGRPPLDLLRPLGAERMKGWRVSTAVGNVRNNAPELLAPIEGREEGAGRGQTQLGLFTLC